MTSKLMMSTAVIAVSARSSWQELFSPEPKDDKNTFKSYWYTVDDEELGPMIRPTLRLTFDSKADIEDTSRVSLCLAYRHSAGFMDPKGKEIPVKDTWETVAFFTATNWKTQDWTTYYNSAVEDPQDFCSTYGVAPSPGESNAWKIMADYSDETNIYLDVMRPFNIDNAGSLVMLPTNDMDMVMNYAVLPESFLLSEDRSTRLTYVSGQSIAADEWSDFKIFVDSAYSALGMTTSALLIAATLY